VDSSTKSALTGTRPSDAEGKVQAERVRPGAGPYALDLYAEIKNVIVDVA
jgi:hypothetical protein